MDRRSFLRATALSAVGLAAAPAVRSTAPPGRQKILVLGGTNFLGPAIVESAVAAGHEVTLLNRGITRPHLFPDVEKLRGDRRNGRRGLDALGRERSWDAVIDVWPADVSIVEASARVLADRANYYFFVSSIAVYRSFAHPWVKESAALRDSGYGGEKARSEELVSTLYPDRSGVVRCPSIFGPRDPGSSLHYWLRNLNKNEDVLAPGSGEDPVQFVDVRDVGRWIVELTQQRIAGIYNSAPAPITFRRFLDLCRDVTASDAALRWVDKDYLYAQNVEAFMELPLWIPVAEDPGFFQIDGRKARRTGFDPRPPDETLSAAWRWYQSAFFADTLFPHNGWGMSDERQAELLARWRSRKG